MLDRMEEHYLLHSSSRNKTHLVNSPTAYTVLPASVVMSSPLLPTTATRHTRTQKQRNICASSVLYYANNLRYEEESPASGFVYLGKEAMSSGGGGYPDLEQLAEKLKGEVDVQENLQRLNSLLAANPATVQATLHCLPLPVLFSLQAQEASLVELTCSVLDKLLHLLPATELVLHGTYLELGLQYPETLLVRTCLQALASHASEDCVQSLVSGDTMLHLICQTMASEELQCASLASKIILAVFPVAIATGREEVLLTELKTLLSHGPVVRMRVYGLCVDVCLQVAGTTAALLVTDAELLGRLILELKDDDVLVKMNILELVGQLTENDSGREFIRKNRVLDLLHEELTKCKQDAFGAMLIPCRECVCVLASLFWLISSLGIYMCMQFQ